MKRLGRFLAWPGPLIGLAVLSLGINITFVVIAHVHAPEVVSRPAPATTHVVAPDADRKP